MTIILLSTWFGGQEGMRAFKDAVATLGPSPNVAIIHNALRFKVWRTLSNCLIGQKFRKIGCQPIFIDLTKDGQLEEKLKQRSITYLGRGDTRRFKKILRETTFAAEIIIEHLTQKGGILIGSSAGAIICGADIKTGVMLGDSKKIRIRSRRGMNLLGSDTCVLPHDKKKYTSIINQ